MASYMGSIINGLINTVAFSDYGILSNGTNNIMCTSISGIIGNGNMNTLCLSNFGSVVNGCGNSVLSSGYSTILGGYGNLICLNTTSTILNGVCNKIIGNGGYPHKVLLGMCGQIGSSDANTVFAVGYGFDTHSNATNNYNLIFSVNKTGNLLIKDGTQGAGKVLTSDANGLTTWCTPESIYTPLNCIDLSGVNNNISHCLLTCGASSSITWYITNCYAFGNVNTSTSINTIGSSNAVTISNASNGNACMSYSVNGYCGSNLCLNAGSTNANSIVSINSVANANALNSVCTVSCNTDATTLITTNSCASSDFGTYSSNLLLVTAGTARCVQNCTLISSTATNAASRAVDCTLITSNYYACSEYRMLGTCSIYNVCVCGSTNSIIAISALGGSVANCISLESPTIKMVGLPTVVSPTTCTLWVDNGGFVRIGTGAVSAGLSVSVCNVVYTSTTNQTIFSLPLSTPSMVQVYLNGLKLPSSCYTLNTNDITFSTGILVDDIVDIDMIKIG